MPSVRDRVAEVTSRYSMLPRGTRVAVAVSGGADSVCLFHLLLEGAAGEGWALHVCHVDHGWRAGSGEDAAFVEALARQHGLPFHLHQARAASSGNREQHAREERRRFFTELIEAGKVDRVALGHTRTDQAETVLLRLLRGTGVAGLAGILPVVSPGLVRPLLEVAREETAAFLAEHGLPWRDDPTNQCRDFTRNRVRAELLPALSESYNPQIVSTLAHTAALAQDEEEYWRVVIPPLVAQLCRAEGAGFVLDVREFRGHPKAVQRRILRDAFRQAKGDLRRLEFGHVEQALSLALQPDGHGRLQVPGLDLFRSFHWLRIAPPVQSDLASRLWEVDAVVPGECAVPGSSRRVVFEVVERPDPSAVPAHRYNGNRWTLDWSAVGPFVKLRAWQPGDSYRRAGGPAERRLKDLFQEGRIPLWERRVWPILTVGGEIAWVWRFGVAEGFQVGPDTSRVLWVREQESVPC